MKGGEQLFKFSKRQIKLKWENVNTMAGVSITAPQNIRGVYGTSLSYRADVNNDKFKLFT